ncbi:MAG TPA: NAD(P)/FAD-dependent oxidoreductase [Bacteroidia bacterium]|nr:NAD(P)/FAD-dependent oxidoreductase [Bacteroidia bacterium]
MNSPSSNTFDIIIVGAGPAGTACAIALKDSGLKIAVLEKHKFPRDKVCGDAIPSRVPKVLRSIAPGIADEIKSFDKKITIRGCKVVAPNLNHVDIFFKLDGYISTRLDFDNKMAEVMKKYSAVTFYEADPVNDVTVTEDGVEIKSEKNILLRSKLVIGCDGAHSVIEKKLTATKMDPKHYTGAVRAYYKNIAATGDEMMEIHLLKEYPAAYFWIFPLQNKIANVGFGMLSEKISERKVNLRKSLLDIVNMHPTLSKRFQNAEALDEVTGYGLPMGSRRVKISGQRFMLCGDAASLIDPATGEGIGNAMLSGKLAAEQAIKCFQQNNFSEDFMKMYDEDLFKIIGKELKQKYFIQRTLGERAWLANATVTLASKNKFVKKWLQKMF